MDLVLGKSGGNYVRPDPMADLHKSLAGFWWLAELLWKRHFNWKTHEWERRANLGRRRTIPPQSLIHKSAYERGTEYQSGCPPTAYRQTSLTCNRTSCIWQASHFQSGGTS
jgi:hypothetical protein